MGKEGGIRSQLQLFIKSFDIYPLNADVPAKLTWYFTKRFVYLRFRLMLRAGLY